MEIQKVAGLVPSTAVNNCGRQFCNWLGQAPGRVLCSYGYQLTLCPTRLVLTSVLEVGDYYLMLGYPGLLKETDTIPFGQQIWFKG